MFKPIKAIIDRCSHKPTDKLSWQRQSKILPYTRARIIYTCSCLQSFQNTTYSAEYSASTVSLFTHPRAGSERLPWKRKKNNLNNLAIWSPPVYAETRVKSFTSARCVTNGIFIFTRPFVLAFKAMRLWHADARGVIFEIRLHCVYRYIYTSARVYKLDARVCEASTARVRV